VATSRRKGIQSIFGPIGDGGDAYTMLQQANGIGDAAFHTANHERDAAQGRGDLEALWYAIYTTANHEKRVAQQLGHRSVEHLLPLYESVRRWKDRRVRLQLPLFPGYVFVQLALRDRLQVLQIPGVVHLVSFGGQPAALQKADIDAVKICLSSGNRVEPHPYLQAGQRARVKSGPLQGLEGIILRQKNGPRFVLSFDYLMRSVAVEMDEFDLAPASQPSGDF
jgi:transcription antitermination factor NusG